MENRREFIKRATFGGTALFGAASSMSVGVRSVGSLLANDDTDRSPNRDPLTLQGSTIVVDGLSPAAVSEESIAMLHEGHVDCWQRTMYGIDSFADVYNFLDSHKDAIVPVVTVDEIRSAHANKKIALILGWQAALDLGTRMIEPLTPFGSSLRAYYQMGLRVSGIAYNVSNIFGGGCLEPKVGLTMMGQRLVEEIHKLNILLDVGAHTAEQTSFDAIGISKGVPVICSHTNMAALFTHPRCISDRLAEAIAATGGVIGITAVNFFLGHATRPSDVNQLPRVGVNAYVDQLEYLRELVGVDHVGLGPDFGQGRASIWAMRNRVVLPPDVFGEGFLVYAKDFENPSEFPHVTRALIRRGWSSGEIRKILGENWLRVYKQVWRA
jgi:membrane dipeptidase